MRGTSSNTTELADIFGKYGEEYSRSHYTTYEQRKAMKAISDCRTSKMGGNKLQCTYCGNEELSYNSCRNRNCPKCGYVKQIKWAEKLKSSLIPVRHFHVVFTLPRELRALIYINQEICYNILFKSSSQALQQAALNPEFLGAETGFIAILHTWTQDLRFHPHVHMIVPAGGLDIDGMEWRHSQKKFFVPVRALSKMYRAKFIESLMKEYRNGNLKIPPIINGINYGYFENLEKILREKEWNVYTKRAFGGVSKVVGYLARYTNRVAITNSRIISMEGSKVKFRWKDYKSSVQWKQMELYADEFIKRFLFHVLPSGFYKIRYFGILACVNNKTKKMQSFLLLKAFLKGSFYEVLLWHEVLLKAEGKDLLLCPVCKKGRMVQKGKLAGDKFG